MASSITLIMEVSKEIGFPGDGLRGSLPGLSGARYLRRSAPGNLPVLNTTSQRLVVGATSDPLFLDHSGGRRSGTGALRRVRWPIAFLTSTARAGLWQPSTKSRNGGRGIFSVPLKPAKGSRTAGSWSSLYKILATITHFRKLRKINPS